MENKKTSKGTARGLCLWMQQSSVQYCTKLTLQHISFFFYLCRPRNTSIWDEDKRQPADCRFPGAVCYKYISKLLLFSLLHLT